MYRRGASVGFTGSKSVYDDVHGGTPMLCVSSLAPCVEDYSEIFGSFHALRASSIPVLDLPDVDETEVFLDACSSSFDYNEVFRSFNSLDFSVSFEDLVNRSDSGDADSNEEVWSPAAFNSMSEEFDISGTDHLFSNGDPYHSFVGSPEVNISYHKANSRSNGDIFNEIAHVTELHAVPGFVCTVREMSKVLLKNAEKPSLSVTDDNNLSTDYNLEKRKAKHLKETVLCPFNDSCAGQSFENYIRPHRYDRNDSSYRETFVSISEIDLRTRPSQMPPPSRPPPSVEDTKGDSSKKNSDYSSVVSEGKSDDSSPSFFDVEIDAFSSSAVSAAAIKEAMENAKAKLKSAREQMEKKKEGFQNSTGLDSKKDIKEEGRVRKIVDESNRMKDERIKGTCEREDNEANLSVREEKKNVWKTALEVQELIEGESLLNAPEKIDEANEWKDESQFFELVTMDESMKDFELTCTKKSLGLGAKVHGQKQKAAMETLEEQSEYVRRAKPVIEDHDLLELEKKHKVRIEPCGLEETKIRSVPVREASEQKKNENKIPVATENCEPRMNENFTIDEKNCETEKKINGSDEFKNHNNVMEAESKERKSVFKQNLVGADKVVKIGKILEQSHKNVLHKDRHEALEKDGKEKMLLEAFEVAGNGKVLKILEQEANEKRSKELLEKVESEKRLEMAMKQQDNERILKVDFEQLENEKRLREASKRKKGKKTLKEASKKREYKKQLKGAPEQDQLERTHKVVEFDNAMEFAYERTEVRKSVSSCTSEDNRMRSIGAHNNFERQAKTYEAFEQVEGHKVPKEVSEWEETAKIFKPDIDLEDRKEEDRKELKKVYRSMEKNKINRETQSAEGNAVHGEKEVKSAKRNHVHIEQEIKSAKQSHLSMEEDDLCVCDEPCELVDFMKTFLPNRFYNIDESIEVIKAFGEANAHKDKEEMRSECRINEKQARAVEMENVSLFESFKASDRAEEELEQDKCQSSMKNAKKSFPLDGNVNKVNGEREREESENGKNKCPIQGSDISLPSNNFMKEVVEGGAVVEQLHEERIKSFPQVECVPENQERDFAHQHKERLNEVKYAQVAPIQELNRDKVMPTGPMKECVEIMRETGASQLAAPEGKQKSQKLDQQATQTTERRGKNITEPFTPEDNVTEKMKRERELENERLQKIEEEREREKEREKDRMAVDLATLEARKNAYAEAREKTERASVERMTTEARQRAMAEARERLERACAEAREKSSVGKAAMEAKIRAEHVAVERAMAEVREHAAEKAKAERAAFEAIERVQRSVSDKFSTSRNNVMRQSYSSSDLLDMQFQSTRDLYSSTLGERYEGVESESAQRCKARLERHRRTAERAAKALAEKNMRDLIAQREQAVRNRIAETLDADVRRWSSGKEGNLRALLSTLQYILGPDSGWQPIPLTEVITSAAVKKAYRKATLCVHPDKLQQRGASIQQKYTCEKVYDLLKEAWNKFNSEER